LRFRTIPAQRRPIFLAAQEALAADLEIGGPRALAFRIE
jgi:hypothetical protein